jgi:hypothetical protein
MNNKLVGLIVIILIIISFIVSLLYSSSNKPSNSESEYDSEYVYYVVNNEANQSLVNSDSTFVPANNINFDNQKIHRRKKKKNEKLPPTIIFNNIPIYNVAYGNSVL